MFRFFLALSFVLAALPAHAAAVAEISPAGMHQVLAPPQMPGLGAKAAPVIVVEYLDYNCPYCRKIAPDLVLLAKADPKVRVLFKEWPIFGGVSIFAAKAALAANYQGKYLAAHQALISSNGRLASEEQVRAALKGAGIDLARLEADMNVHGDDIDKVLARNGAEAEALGLQGTPGLIIGDILVPGALSYGDMQKLVAMAEGKKS